MSARAAGGVVLLVRNAVAHDARVLRAARLAARTGPVLVVGAATETAPAGELTIGETAVIRLAAQGAVLGALRALGRRRSGRSGVARPGGVAPPGPAAPPGTGSHNTRARLRRTLLGLSWMLRAARVTISRRPALVHANDWNTMWAGVAAKVACGCALVYDSHELWPDRNGRWEWRPWLIACEWLFVHVADAVITTSPGHAGALAERYRIPMPGVVRNLPETTVAPGDPRTRRARPLVYVGGLMPGRGLEQAIDALPLLPGVRLRAIGPGASAYRAGLRARAERAGVADRLELCDPIPPADVVGALAGAAAGVCLIQPICRSYELCLPNKLFEYLAAGLPVLASDLPVIAPVVREAGVGEVVAPGDVEAIAAGVRRLLDGGGNPARVAAFAQANRWPDEAPRLAATYERVLARRGAGGGPGAPLLPSSAEMKSAPPT